MEETYLVKHTVVYNNKKPKKDLVLKIEKGDNVNVEVPTGYKKMTMELDWRIPPFKQIYEKLGVEYFDETQLLKEDFME